jgi:multicomponent Na+:H+ antiporter subunit E
MIGRWLVLIVIWVALWGEVSVVNILTGLFMAAALSALFPGPLRSSHRIRPIAAMSFFFYMLRSIVLSSWDVIIAVLLPTAERRHAEVIRVSLMSKSRLINAIAANTISLTPGTVVIAVDPEGDFFDIHVLGRTDSEEFHQLIHDHQRRIAKFIVEKT